MQDFYTTISRYLSGEASPEDAVKMDEWIALSEENKAIFDRYFKIYEAAGRNVYIPDRHTNWNTILAKSNRGAVPSAAGISIIKSGLWILSVIVFCLAGFYFYQKEQSPAVSKHPQKTILLADSSDNPAPGPMQELASFSFNNTRLVDALAEIEKAYDLSISIPPTGFDSCRITAFFDNKDHEEVINVLSFTLQFNFEAEKDGKVYRIIGKGCE
jgi:ferric-dicitrate binding protein FerR (iron transport regulator)